MQILDFQTKDLTPKGKVPLIIYSDKAGDLSNIKDTYAGMITKRLPVINGFVVEVDSTELSEIRKRVPNSVNVVVDRNENFLSPVVTEPEIGTRTDVAVDTLGVKKLWDMGYMGRNVGIAVIDTGIYPHPDFASRVIAFKDFVNNKSTAYDDNGHGTHVSGDAAGDGTVSGGKYKGTAPEANLIGIKVLSREGSGSLSTIVEGIQWAIDNRYNHNIRVINMSLGGQTILPPIFDPVLKAAEKAVDTGIVTVCAAGNSGPNPSTVGTPGNANKVLTVGAMDDHGTVTRADDDVAEFSSRGPASWTGAIKPDIITPGVKITAANAPGSYLDQLPQVPHVGPNYITISGTSMATPIMAGLAALMIQRYPAITPTNLKQAFMNTAEKLPGFDANAQGSGVANPTKAIIGFGI